MSPRVEILGLPPLEAARLRSAACAVAVLAGQAAPGPVHVEGRAITARLALDGALTRLERRLARTAAVARDSRRRPKKYYAAARALAD
jgi:hypothetical protein